MIGMMQIGIYLMAVYLVFKGLEILQLALTSSRPDRAVTITIGMFALIGSVVLGVSFAFWAERFATSIATRMDFTP